MELIFGSSLFGNCYAIFLKKFLTGCRFAEAELSQGSCSNGSFAACMVLLTLCYRFFFVLIVVLQLVVTLLLFLIVRLFFKLVCKKGNCL